MLLAVFSALWLGILTSVSPCPLATNIAAISFIGKRVEKPLHVLGGGLLYTLGRALVYTVIGVLLTLSLLSASRLSSALQHYMNVVIGPVLIVTGMFVLELIGSRLSGPGVNEQLARRLAGLGALGPLLLGMLFALAFCPVSAALFFGSLLSLATLHKSPVLLPALFGIGTALPVVVFAAILAFSVNAVGKVYQRLGVFEYWMRRVTGVVLILAGIYLCLHYNFELL